MRYFTREQLDRALHARSMVVVGAKKDGNYTWLRRLAEFKGKLSAVHVNEQSIREIQALGIDCYRSVADVPGPVDYVQVTAPRRAAIDVLAQCVEAKVGAVTYFTSGFSETDAEGRELQEQMETLSRESGVPIIGPNCLGLYNPAIGITTGPFDMPIGVSGPIGVVSQSGTHHNSIVKNLLAWHGVHAGLGVSFGNASVLDAADWIEFMGGKDEVEVLAVYIEGIGRGPADRERFIKAVRQVVARKPVLIWKGGNTLDGGRVTAAHTGADPVSPEDWAAILEASGATGVDTLIEMVDSIAVLAKLPKLRGPNGGVIVLTGGQGVAITDTLGRAGLRLPELSQSSLDELATFFSPIGGSYHNPLDAAYAMESSAVLARELAILDRDPKLDFAMMDIYVGGSMTPQRLTSNFGRYGAEAAADSGPSFLDVLAEHSMASSKPFFMTVTAGADAPQGLELERLIRERGILCFPSIERASVAYVKALEAGSGR